MQNCTYTNTKPFVVAGGSQFESKVVKIYDGDTYHIVKEIEGTFYRFPARILGVNTAERRTTCPIEKELDTKATKFVKDLIENKKVFVECEKHDMYGRLLVHIYLEDGKSMLSQLLIDKKLGIPYDGTTNRYKHFQECPTCDDYHSGQKCKMWHHLKNCQSQ